MWTNPSYNFAFVRVTLLFGRRVQKPVSCSNITKTKFPAQTKMGTFTKVNYSLQFHCRLRFNCTVVSQTPENKLQCSVTCVHIWVSQKVLLFVLTKSCQKCKCFLICCERARCSLDRLPRSNIFSYSSNPIIQFCFSFHLTRFREKQSFQNN